MKEENKPLRACIRWVIYFIFFGVVVILARLDLIIGERFNWGVFLGFFMGISFIMAIMNLAYWKKHKEGLKNE